MIRNFRHKGLKQLYDGQPKGIEASLRARVARILTVLDSADSADSMNLPGFDLHPLSGNLEGFWAVSVNKNWRIIFRFENGCATDVDFRDYHKR